MAMTAKSFGLDVTAPFTVKHDLIEGTTLYGNVTEAFRVWGDSSTGSSTGDHVHIVDDKGNVLDNNERSINGLFAAGELVGGLFYENYPGGSGLMAGAVYGKIAGENAAYHAVGNN